MIVVTSFWIELPLDAWLVEKVRFYGQKRLAQDTGINNPTINRWLSGSIGMKEEWYKKIKRQVINNKIPGPRQGRPKK